MPPVMIKYTSFLCGIEPPLAYLELAMTTDIVVKSVRNMSVDEAQRLIERSWAYAFEKQAASLESDMKACGLQMHDFKAEECPYVLRSAPGDNNAMPGPIELVVGLAVVAAVRKRVAAARMETGLRELWTRRFAKELER
jgi:hypothetical protein